MKKCNIFLTSLTVVWLMCVTRRQEKIQQKFSVQEKVKSRTGNCPAVGSKLYVFNVHYWWNYLVSIPVSDKQNRSQI